MLSKELNPEFLNNINHISLLLGYKLSELQSKSRKQENRNAKQFLIYFLLKKRLTLETIGIILNRHYASIINARKKFIGYLEYEKSLIDDYNCFEEKANLLWKNPEYRKMRIYKKGN